MKASRRPLASAEEPNALRLSRPTPSDLLTSHTFTESPTPPSNFTNVHPDPIPSSSEPTSWLPAYELASPTFNAHDFLQHALSHRFEKTSSRQSNIPLLDHPFDADAALAALDTVESALRKSRDISAHEERHERDELRKALHLSAKKREHLVKTSETVTVNISSFVEVGKQATSALASDLASLKVHSERLAALQDAHDLVSLLTLDSTELGAVHVAKLLAKARALLDDNSINHHLSPDDIPVANKEITRCETELASSIFDWMRNASDSSNTQTVRDCALAAVELGVENQFIREYITHAFAFDASQLTPSKPDSDTQQAPLDHFRNVCWEVANTVKDAIPTIFSSFANPSKPLAVLLQMLPEKKVITVADSIVKALQGTIRSSENVLDGLKSQNSDASQSAEHISSESARSSIERIRGLAMIDSKESWREGTRQISADKKRYLTVFAEIFKVLAKLKADLFDLCRVPGSEKVEQFFYALPDPYNCFIKRNLPTYLNTEKTWINDQLGAAFIEITRIELQTPRLAPREKSDAGVYHRYRAFYSHISSSFQKMTRQAIESTYESLCRTAAVLSNIPSQPNETDIDAMSSGFDCVNTANQEAIVQSEEQIISNTNVLSNSMEGSSALEDEEEADGDNVERRLSTGTNPGSATNIKFALREVIGCLVMSYLANAETILQAATHLLPVCEKDAEMQELWISGASPLTAYVQAIEVLSSSNEILDEFLLTLETGDHISDVGGLPHDLEKDIGSLITVETRELLHGEFTSGLSDLAGEAQIGVRAAVASLRARLYAMLTTPSATGAYSGITKVVRKGGGRIDEDGDTSLASEAVPSLDVEPTPAFIGASIFVEQQLQSVKATVHGGNRDFVISELSRITREAVLHCWCSCEGTFSTQGALQVITDGRTMMRVFQNYGSSVEVVECLPAIGQLFLESVDGLWSCVESKALATVDARTIVSLLKKRKDFRSEGIRKVCQSLGAALEERSKML